jgi:CheY-like chemotaxis protein
MINPRSNRLHDRHEQPLASRFAERLQRGLVADDVRATRELVDYAMQKHGLASWHAVDGLDAWEQLQSKAIDVVITDIEMPRWTGIDLLKKLRRASNQRLRDLPVIVLSSLDNQRLATYVRSFSNTYLMHKPVSLRQLDIMLGLIETIHQLRKQRNG